MALFDECHKTGNQSNHKDYKKGKYLWKPMRTQSKKKKKKPPNA